MSDDPDPRCDLAGSDMEARVGQWQALAPLVFDRTRLADGLRVTFRPEAWQTLAGLVAAERSCCGWAEWSVAREEGRSVLTVTGPAPAIDQLAAAIGFLRP